MAESHGTGKNDSIKVQDIDMNAMNVDEDGAMGGYNLQQLLDLDDVKAGDIKAIDNDAIEQGAQAQNHVVPKNLKVGDTIWITGDIPILRAAGVSGIDEERDLQEIRNAQLVVNTMDVSEYTDRIDILSYRSKTRKIHKELTEICSILCGFVVATDYRAGQKLIKDKEFA